MPPFLFTNVNTTVAPSQLTAANLNSMSVPLTGVVSKSANYTMVAADTFVKCDATAGSFTITLPSAAAVTPDWTYTVKRLSAGSNVVTIVPPSGLETIDGAASIVLNLQWQGVTLASDGTNWFIRTTVNAKHPPTASFVPTVTNADVTTVNNSFDPDGDNMTYSWNWGDGSSASTTFQPSHSYTATGTYIITLTATDSGGLTSTASVSVGAVLPTADQTGNRLPYAATSGHNRTLSQKYPGGVKVMDPKFIDIIQEGYDFNTGGGGSVPNHMNQAPFTAFGTDPTQYTYPVYILNPNTPTGLIQWTGAFTRDDGTQTLLAGGGGFTGNGAANVPANIPFPATVKPAVGSDAQVILWNPVTGDEYNFWGCVTDGSGLWGVNGSGRHVCTNWSWLSGEKTNPGKAVGTPSAYGSRGAGIMYNYGLIRPWEVAQGHIDHEIALAFSIPAYTFISPATKSDGKQIPETHLPEGALIFLRNDFQVDDLPDPISRMVARALQTYGARVIDNAGNPKIMFESDNTATVAGTQNWAGQIASNLIREIPIQDFRAVDYTGSSILVESDIRWDMSIPADPVPTLPAVLGTVIGSVTGTTSGAINTASQTPNTGELIMCHVSIRSNNAEWVNTVTGNGCTWKRFRRRIEPSNSAPSRGQSQNLVTEIWATRAPASPTAGAVSVTLGLGSASSVVIQVHRFTAGTTIGKCWAKDNSSIPMTGPSPAVNTANPQITIRGTTAQSLIVGFVTHRTGTLSVGAGETAVRLNDTIGTSAVVLTASTMTAPGGGDITLSETLPAAEWIFTAYEVT